MTIRTCNMPIHKLPILSIVRQLNAKVPNPWIPMDFTNSQPNDAILLSSLIWHRPDGLPLMQIPMSSLALNMFTRVMMCGRD
jgi:hypothetical protein